ncbi:MAG: ribosome maturation factor RimM, partial [Oscillospiraceae bacterium]
MKKEFIETGKISSVVGLKGEVKITPWADSPDFLCDFSSFYSNNGEKEFIVEKIRTQKTTVVAKFKNINTSEEASAFRNTILYIKRDDVVLDENEFFIQDLIGCIVKDSENQNIIYG